MTFDAKIPGSPGQVDEVVTWLDHVNRRILAVNEEVWTGIGAVPLDAWQGSSRIAWRDRQSEILNAIEETAADLYKSIEPLTAYAGQLRRAQGAVERAIDACAEAGLVVDGTRVSPPEEMNPEMPIVTSPDIDQEEEARKYLEKRRKVDTWNTLIETYADRLVGLETWVADNLPKPSAKDPIAEQIAEFRGSVTEDTQDKLKRTAEKAWKAHIEEETGEAAKNLREFREDLANAKRAEQSTLNERLREAQQEQDDLDKRIKAYDDTPVGKVIKHLGPVGDVVGWATNVASGEDWFGGAVEIAGGAGGAALGGFVGGPVGAAIGGVAGGTAAKSTYESVVPQGVREAIASGPFGFYDTYFG